MGKVGIKHASTRVANIGPSATGGPEKFVIVDTDAGPRVETSQTIQDNATTASNCTVGTLVKYINLHIQCASRTEQTGNSMGWVEYAVVCKREQTADPTNAQAGLLTLGNVCTNLYRGQCIWTGFVPIFINGANGSELSLKLPKEYQFQKIGYETVLYVWFRSQNSAATGDDSNRIVLSYNYKAYS